MTKNSERLPSQAPVQQFFSQHIWSGIFWRSSDRDTHLCTVTRTYSRVQHGDREHRPIEFTDNGLRRRIHQLYGTELGDLKENWFILFSTGFRARQRRTSWVWSAHGHARRACAVAYRGGAFGTDSSGASVLALGLGLAAPDLAPALSCRSAALTPCKRLRVPRSRHPRGADTAARGR